MPQGRLGLPKTLRNRLADARRGKGFSQSQLGAQVGLPQAHISGIETGRVIPRYDTLVEIVRVLGHDLLLVPRELVPVVQALVRDRHAKVEGEDERPLYLPDEDEDDEERP